MGFHNRHIEGDLHPQMMEDYAKLVADVALIDERASNWLATGALSDPDIRVNLQASLNAAFTWINTPQGHEYWNNIHQEVKKLRKLRRS